MKKSVATLLILIILTTIIPSCLAEVLMPQTGNTRQTKGSLTIDYSNCTEGYVMVKAKTTKTTLKLRVVHDKMDIHYTINSNGQYEVIPLQDGNGKYTFTLYAKTHGSQYKKLNTITLMIDMPDTDRCFLYPNQYINYTATTPAILHAQKICEGITDPIEKARAIYRDIFVEDIAHEDVFENGEPYVYYTEEIKFTYRRIDSNPLPNINKAFEKRAGICKDQSGLYVAMLRSVGVPAIYAVGDGDPSHAWVLLIINGKRYLIDPTLQMWFDHTIPDDMTYTRIY